MNSKFLFIYFILFYFILDHFVFTDEDYDMWAGEWTEGKTAHFCIVFGQNRIVHDRVREKYDRIRPYTDSVTADLGRLVTRKKRKKFSEKDAVNTIKRIQMYVPLEKKILHFYRCFSTIVREHRCLGQL